MTGSVSTIAEWNWAKFQGSAEALRYNRRDLPTIDAVLEFVKGRTACVQAGGNLGIYPKRLAREFSTCYTFEPAPDLFGMLCHNAPELNIFKYQAALGDTRGLVGLSRNRRDGKPNNHEGITHISGSGVCPTMLIDDLFLPVCDLIYLDVEGWELYALQGAKDTIRRCRPVIAVEINRHIEEVGWTADHVRAFIKLHGYQHLVTLGSDEVFGPVGLESAA